MVRADRYGRSAPVQDESGQSQFASLKLRSLALVPSSGAQSAPSNSTPGNSTVRLFLPRRCAPVRDSRSFRAPASPVPVRGVSDGRDVQLMPGTVPVSGQPAAGLSPPGAAGAFPPNKGKAVARLLPAPRSGCLPLPLPTHTRSRQETRPGIPPGPPRGRQSPGLRRTPLHRKC